MGELLRGEIEAQSPDALSQAFPGWTVWRSDVGCWYATRRAQVSLDAIRRGLAMTVDADTAEQLREKLIEQQRIEGSRC